MTSTQLPLPGTQLPGTQLSVDEIIQRLDAHSVCDPSLQTEPWGAEAAPVTDRAAPKSPAAPSGPKTPTATSIPKTPTTPSGPPLAHYFEASPAELQERISQARKKLGKRLCILGHYYQRDEIVQHADYVGDSYQLAVNAQNTPEADYIVFCGVHFMAETADILSQDNQQVILPNLSAGCSMADMANLEQVSRCWDELEEICSARDGKQAIIPVTYMNSAADLKAFCGRHNGIVCTSSNAREVLQWAFSRGNRVLFFPDQHLGRNTAHQMGIPESQIQLWDPARPHGGIQDPSLYDAASVILWKGFCSVHQRFTVNQIQKAREAFPGVQVIVHPECSAEVVAAADGAGSTAYIVKAVAEAPRGSTIAIGTEINLVNRLAGQYPDKTIFCLDPVVCPCSTMYRIHPAYLAWVLDNLLQDTVVNRIVVDKNTAADAKVALQRMLEARP